MKKFLIFKLILLVLAAIINLARFLPLPESRAFFADVERSEQNSFMAGSFNFSVDATNFSPLEYEDQGSGMPATITSQSPRDFNLVFSAQNPVGDLCQDIELAAVSGNNDSGRVSLSLFNYPAGSFAAVGGIWYFSANLRSGAVDWQGKSCSFDLVFSGAQSGGYSYQQTISALVAAPNAESAETVQGASFMVQGAVSGAGVIPVITSTSTDDGVRDKEIKIDSLNTAAIQGVILDENEIGKQVVTEMPPKSPQENIAPQEALIEAPPIVNSVPLVSGLVAPVGDKADISPAN